MFLALAFSSPNSKAALKIKFVSSTVYLSQRNLMNTNEYLIRRSKIEDLDGIFDLYKTVSKTIGGLARAENEITMDYIRDFTEKSLERGVQFVMVDELNDNSIIAEIHCYKLAPVVFGHILGELTISVDSLYQGKGLGRKLFQALLDFVSAHRNDILRVELIARESNSRAIALYESLGFVKEGRMLHRIRSNAEFFEADIPMAWFNPNFNK